MKTDIKNFAALLSIAICTNEEYDENEKETLSDIANAFEINEEQLIKEVETSLNTLNNYSEEQLNEHLNKVVKDVDKKEIEPIFEATIEMILSDGVVTNLEVENLLTIADALGIEHSRVILMLIDLAKNDSDIIIEL